MFLASLELRDFRRYASVHLDLGNGVTVIEGLNGAGKTTLLEAVAWVALGRSFRGVPDAALVRDGAEVAVVRAAVDTDGRRQTLDAELRAAGRNRVLVNGHPLARSRDRLDLLRVTIFAPDDLALVKGGPAGRRDYLDDLLVVLAPRYEAARADYEKVLRHRNALLKGSGRGPDAATTLDVFDDQLARAGAELVRGRLRLIERLLPQIAAAYEHLAGRPAVIHTRYEADWAPEWDQDGPDPEAVPDTLRAALARLRPREIDRGVTLAGPHRDEWRLLLDGLDTRSHASQGEQRSLALALRLAGHEVCRATIEASPVLLLDDVFSELDDRRAAALAAALPPGQTLITTATALPAVVAPEMHLQVDAGTVVVDAA
ncbi:MAG: DNA replication/repair protein RecF [Actinomycetota bacterium]